MATRALTAHFTGIYLMLVFFFKHAENNNECLYEDVAVQHSIQKPTAGHHSASTLLNHPVKDADAQHDNALYY